MVQIYDLRNLKWQLSDLKNIVTDYGHAQLKSRAFFKHFLYTISCWIEHDSFMKFRSIIWMQF